MWQCCRCWMRRCAGPLALRKNVHRNARLLVHQLWPTTWFLGKDLKARNAGGSHKLGNAVSSENDVNVLGDATDVTVAPDSPTPADDGFAVQHIEEMIHSFHHTSV